MPPDAVADADHWYHVVTDDSLRQGDIFRDIYGFWVPAELAPPQPGQPPTGQAGVGYKRGDFIIASASCDVDQGGYPWVLLNQVLAADATNVRAAPNELSKHLEVMRRGVMPSRFLLAASSSVDPSFPLSFVTSKIHALLPIGYVHALCAGPRLRLRSPFREQFGNWVGSCFSRVGPEDDHLIPRFTEKLYTGQLHDIAVRNDE